MFKTCMRRDTQDGSLLAISPSSLENFSLLVDLTTATEEKSLSFRLGVDGFHGIVIINGY